MYDACLQNVATRVSVLTVATRGACLVWDVAAGGVPQQLRMFLEDASARKCRVAAGELARGLLRTADVHVDGLLELRHLYAAANPSNAEVQSLCSAALPCPVLRQPCAEHAQLCELLRVSHLCKHTGRLQQIVGAQSATTVQTRHRFVQAASSTLATIAGAVMGVQAAQSPALEHSNWSMRPLAYSQAHCTMQIAWLHAHMMDRLGSVLGWQTALLDACVVNA